MMSMEESSSGAAQVCPIPEVVACIRAVVEELLDANAGTVQWSVRSGAPLAV